MNDMDKAIKIIVEEVSKYLKPEEQAIPLGISNRHIHLSQADLEKCFGKGYELTPSKELSQPGQFACKETMTICGPKGSLERVRVLGPVRGETQVELLASDNFKLGIKAPLRLSGKLDGTPGVTLIGPVASVYLEKGAIVAKRHIHMTPEDGLKYGVSDGQQVSVKLPGERGGIYSDVVIRITESSSLEMHIDTEEANAMGVSANTKLELIK